MPIMSNINEVDSESQESDNSSNSSSGSSIDAAKYSEEKIADSPPKIEGRLSRTNTKIDGQLLKFRGKSHIVSNKIGLPELRESNSNLTN